MDQALVLVVAIAVLFAGPLLVRLLHGQQHWLPFFDGYLLVSVGGLCLLHLLPESLASAGAWGAVAALVGLMLPVLLERRIAQAHGWALIAAFVGLWVHSTLDGAAIVAASHVGHGHHLELAVILHRLPVGILVYLTASQARGPAVGWFVVIALGLGTWLGYTIGQPLLDAASPFTIGVFQAFVVGALLHVLGHDAEGIHGSHDHHHGHDHVQDHDHEKCVTGSQIRASVYGAILAFLTLVALGGGGGELHEHASTIMPGQTFLILVLESAPALLLAYLSAGLIRAVLVPKTIKWLGRGSVLTQSTKGMAFGLPLPICSCGVLPYYETLVKKGVPPAAGLAFLVATPELGLDAVLLSVPLLGAELTIARVIAAIIVALTASWLISRLIEKSKTEEVEPQNSTESFYERLKNGVHYGLVDLVDHTLPWVLVGIGIAALAGPLVDSESIGGMPQLLQVPIFALIGIPLYVCASGATPLAAVAIFQGVSPGAALAFLLTGPATNATTFGVLTSLHGKKVAVAFGFTVAMVAISLGWCTDLWVDASGLDLNDQHHHGTWLQKASLVGLGLLFLASLVRQGPRGVLNQVVRPMPND